jgi:predicted transcriptional regulator of viral defense system
MPVSLHSSIHLGAFKLVRGRTIRVSTLGRTFLDMVRDPSICGGMRHCIDVYREHGAKYKSLIIDELNQHGTQIEKSRVGYLLEEVAGIVGNTSLEEWAKHVQRGGSRKLDPSNEYEPIYSEKWCISLNVPDLGAST